MDILKQDTQERRHFCNIQILDAGKLESVGYADEFFRLFNYTHAQYSFSFFVFWLSTINLFKVYLIFNLLPNLFSISFYFLLDKITLYYSKFLTFVFSFLFVPLLFSLSLFSLFTSSSFLQEISFQLLKLKKRDCKDLCFPQMITKYSNPFVKVPFFDPSILLLFPFLSQFLIFFQENSTR